MTPFQIAMQDVLDRAVDVLAEEQLRVTSGERLSGRDSIPFRSEMTKTTASQDTANWRARRFSADKTFTVRWHQHQHVSPDVSQIHYLEMNGTRVGRCRRKHTDTGLG